MTKTLVPWVRPVVESDAELVADIQASIQSGVLTNQGPLLLRFEQEAARFLGLSQAVAVASGTAALHLALTALDLRGGKAVLPAFTYVATLNAVIHSGLQPVFCDIDPDTWTMCPRSLARILAKHQDIRVVVPVNVFGVPPDLEAVGRLAGEHGAALVVDSAHGFGSTGPRPPADFRGAVYAYSFHATKLLPAAEGGLVTCGEEGYPDLLEEVRRLRNHGLAADQLDSRPGHNAKLSELHAAVGLCSLRTMRDALARRREYATRLRNFLRGECGGAFTLQKIPEGTESSYQNLGVLCRCTGQVGVLDYQRELAARGVESRRYFFPPLHRMRFLGFSGALPVTDRVADSVLCLPLHSRMPIEVLEQIESAAAEASRSLHG